MPEEGAEAPDLGYWSSATVVLVSDGETTDEADATRPQRLLAAGVHIETVGVGTAAGTTVDADGYVVHTALDEAALTEIAETTGGEYHPRPRATSWTSPTRSTVGSPSLRSHFPCRPTRRPRGRAARPGLGPRPDSPRKADLMSLSWPWALLVVSVVPALLAFRWWQARRRKRGAVLVSSVALVRSAQPSTTRWRRVVPPALLLLALVALGVAAARPHREVPISSTATTVLLALDVSRSMCSTDVPQPSGGGPAGSDRLHRGTTGGPSDRAGDLRRFRHRDGAPTDDTEALVRAIDSLVNIAGHGDRPGHPGVHRCHRRARPVRRSHRCGRPRHRSGRRRGGDRAPDRWLQQDRVDPATAAEQAADRGIRVYAIVRDRDAGTQRLQRRTGRARWRLRCRARRPGGRGVDRRSTRKPSKGLPTSRGGTYYRAESADQLTDALADLPQHIATAKESVDVAAWFATLAAARGRRLRDGDLAQPRAKGTPRRSRHIMGGGARCGLFACTVTGDGPAGDAFTLRLSRPGSPSHIRHSRPRAPAAGPPRRRRRTRQEWS